jgi:transcriptional regulator
MYIPEHFRVEDQETSLTFIRANPFATLVSIAEKAPYATHLPLVVQQSAGRLLLRGHVARANPQWKSFEKGSELLAIFHGPHAYISPRLYQGSENVPTWNYAAVHVYGPATILTQRESAQDVLQAMISEFDAAYTGQWSSLSEEFRERMLRHIVAFEITATRIETKFKLSQNRTKAEQENVIQALATSSDESVSGIAKLMREQGLGQP